MRGEDIEIMVAITSVGVTRNQERSESRHSIINCGGGVRHPFASSGTLLPGGAGSHIIGTTGTGKGKCKRIFAGVFGSDEV